MDTTGLHRSVIPGAGRCRSLGSGGHEFCGLAPGFLLRPNSQILASSNRPSDFVRLFGFPLMGSKNCFLCVLCVSLCGTQDAGVLLEVLLCNPVEGECGNRTLQARSCHTPCAVGAAPAAQVVAVDPDQVFVHSSAFARVLGLELGLRWVGHQASESPHRHG